MTDHIDVPIIATGDWIDAAWINQYIGDNVRAWRQAYTAAGMIAYALDSNTLAGLAAGANGAILQMIAGVPGWGSGTRWFITQINADVALAAGDGQGRFVIPPDFNGWNITFVGAIRDSGGTGVLTLQLRNITDGVDVLTTKATVDSGEIHSGTAAAPPVIDATKDDVATWDRFAWDVDVPGTNSFYVFGLVGVTKP